MCATKTALLLDWRASHNFIKSSYVVEVIQGRSTGSAGPTGDSIVNVWGYIG